MKLSQRELELRRMREAEFKWLAEGPSVGPTRVGPTTKCKECERLRVQVDELRRRLAVASTVAATPPNVASTGCPVCEARRAVKARAQAKWRRQREGGGA
jgi:hypothetical protein